MITRRSLFNWSLLGLLPRQNDLFKEYLATKSSWHISYHEVVLTGKIRRYQWVNCNDETWFERWELSMGFKVGKVIESTLNSFTLQLNPVPEFTSVRSFCPFYDNDRIGHGHLIDWLEAERLVQHLDEPWLYVLQPQNRPDLIGAKISAVKKDKLVFHKDLEKIEVAL